jgi:uncharacterized protein YqjF (DUF2071 family)
MIQLPEPHPITADPGGASAFVVNRQTWAAVSLLHWQVDRARVQALLPEGLFVDEYEGQTWLGVVPFLMTDVRVPPVPAMRGGSTFPELNVRVYVHDRAGHRGVYFLGLWCTNAPFVALTRALGIAYHRVAGQVHGPGSTGRDLAGEVAHRQSFLRYEFLRLSTKRPASNIRFSATVRAEGDVDASRGLEAWTTARWNMFAERGGALWRYPVHHEPWQLRTATVERLQTNVLERFGFAARAAPDFVHQADPVHTLVSAPRLCRR